MFQPYWAGVTDTGIRASGTARRAGDGEQCVVSGGRNNPYGL